jgi:hypothetical protein
MRVQGVAQAITDKIKAQDRYGYQYAWWNPKPWHAFQYGNRLRRV